MLLQKFVGSYIHLIFRFRLGRRQIQCDLCFSAVVIKTPYADREIDSTLAVFIALLSVLLTLPAYEGKTGRGRVQLKRVTAIRADFVRAGR